MRRLRSRSIRSYSHLFLFMTGLLLLLILSACDTVAPATNTDPNATQVVNLGTPNTDTSTPTATTSSGGTTPTATAPTTNATPTSNAVIPFRISGVSAANPGNYSGACGATKTISISGTIYAPANNAGGTVTYEWLHSDNSVSSQRTITFAPGATALTVSDNWSLNETKGTGASFWAELKTLAPGIWTSSHATFTFTCKREVASASASVAPSNCATNVTKIFVFSGTITFSSSPSTSSVTVSYAWKRSNGASSQTYTVTVPAGHNSISVTPDSWTFSAKGTYSDKLVVSAPNKVTSNSVSVTC